jgi:hypothetical protein
MILATWRTSRTILPLISVLALLIFAPAASASFEITGFDGVALNSDGSASTQAGAHPFEVTTSFSISSALDYKGSLAPEENPRDIEVLLPPGFVGNPTAAPKCTEAQLALSNFVPPFNKCPIDSQVGYTEIAFTLGGTEPTLYKLPVYNMETPLGSPALFGFNVIAFPTYLHARVRTGEDYGVTAALSPAAQATPFVGGTFTLWGVPADPAHNSERSVFCEGGSCTGSGATALAPRRPFLTNPENCSAGPLTTVLRIDSWQNIGQFEERPTVSHLNDGTPAGVDGCSRLPFDPSISVQPSTTSADSPTALSVDLSIPQNEAPGGLAEAYLDKATVTLPQGVTINSAGGDGLLGCTAAEVDLHGPGPAQCPDASKIGTVQVQTPLIDHPVHGAVFAATQKDNPFGSLLATYIAINDPLTGVVVKLAGQVEADPSSGQLTATFDENPQLPFSTFELNFFGGSRAVLRTPPSCGTYTTVGKFSPWTAADPANPTVPETVTSVSSFTIASGPNGGPCPAGGFDPKLSAGTSNPLAGNYSPMSLRLSRPDGSQELKSLTVSLPQGLVGKLAGVAYCSEGQIAAAMARSGEGMGALELASPSCPAASQVGTVSVGAGAGPTPLTVNTGKAYLAGPYKGAPLSLVIVTPALAGPFDLGAVVVRSALEVDPETAKITAVSDPIPSILDGIPLDVRSVQVSMDRPDFILNPTSCEVMRFSGFASSVTGASAPIGDRFQAASCERLAFKPKLNLSLKGGTKRNDHPALRAVLTQAAGQANIDRVSVVLPASEFIDQSRIGDACTRPQFREGQCPAKSILGRARAFSPLLSEPLEGPVYFRSNGGERVLPDVVADLRGQIHVVLVGAVDSVAKKGSEVSRIRNTFATVPDAPVSKFVLELQSGKKGLLVNSANLCKVPNKAVLKMTAQNGKTYDTTPAVANGCGKSHRRRR